MRGDLILDILQTLADSARATGDVLEVILTSPYGTSRRGFEYRLSQLEHARAKKSLVRDRHRAADQKFYTMLYYLKKQGFVREESKSRNKLLRITQSGKKKLLGLLAKGKKRLPSAQNYKAMPSPNWVMVVFDIPEKVKQKRAWLRSVLRELGFRLVQKSVWLGKVKLPADFLADIHRLGLAEHIEIFEITKSGSLSHLV